MGKGTGPRQWREAGTQRLIRFYSEYIENKIIWKQKSSRKGDGFFVCQ